MMLVRPAVVADAEELAELHLRVWQEAYAGLMDPALLAARAARPQAARVAAWRDRIDSTPTWVACAEGADDARGAARIVGFAQAGPGRDDDIEGTELMALYVVAEVYGTGVGHRLLVAAIGDDPAYLWVLDGNRRATGFYERQGFVRDGASRRDEYGQESRMVRGF